MKEIQSLKTRAINSLPYLRNDDKQCNILNCVQLVTKQNIIQRHLYFVTANSPSECNANTETSEMIDIQ